LKKFQSNIYGDAYTFAGRKSASEVTVPYLELVLNFWKNNALKTYSFKDLNEELWVRILLSIYLSALNLFF